MKERDDGKDRSAVSGRVIKMKVKKSSKDKEVSGPQVAQYLCCGCPSIVGSVHCFYSQREQNRKQLLDFLNSSVS